MHKGRQMWDAGQTENTMGLLGVSRGNGESGMGGAGSERQKQR